MIDYLVSFNWVVLPIFLLAGLLLIVFQPFRAFLLAVFISISLSIATITFTRIPELGPYFNLYDACMLISLLACVVDNSRSGRPFRLPRMAMVLIVVLIIGFLNSLFFYGVSYDCVRSFRWALDLPLMFILGANMVVGEKRIKSLLLTLILGTTCAAAQQFSLMSYLNVGDIAKEDPFALRTTMFELSCPEIWLLAGPFMVGRLIPKKRLQQAAAVLLLGVIATLQSRSVAFALALGFLVYYTWFLQGAQALRLQRLLPLGTVVLAAALLLVTFNLTALTENFWERIEKFTTKYETDVTSLSRKRGFYIEMGDWLDSNIVIGNGLGYFGTESYQKELMKRVKYKDWYGIAFGHLGYVTYISQLGIMGFIVYGIWFPFSIISTARKIYTFPDLSPVVLYLVGLTGACFIYKSLWFIFTNSYLTRHIIPGVLAGALWQLAETQEVKSFLISLSRRFPFKDEMMVLDKGIVKQ